MADSPPNDGRCLRNDGRRWRCKNPRFGGKRYCEKHLYYYLKKMSRASSNSKVRASLASAIEKKDAVRFFGSSIGKKMPVRVSDPSIEKKKKSGSQLKAKKMEGIDNVKVSNPSPKVNKLYGIEKKRPRKKRNLSEMTAEKGQEAVMASSASEKKKRGRHPKTKEIEGIEEKKNSKLALKKRKSGGTEMTEEEEEGRVLELGQVWAFPTESDGFPRSYARIDRIIPVIPSLVRVTPLVPHPVLHEEKLFAEQGLSLACGLFRAAESTVTKEISAFTHKVLFEIEGKASPFFKIFPRKGEIWAVYLKWIDLRKRFEYKLVEVVSDFNEKDGVNVFGLVQVEGMDGVYQRQEHEGFHLVRSISRGFMSMFSHQVPASKIVERDVMLWKVMLH